MVKQNIFLVNRACSAYIEHYEDIVQISHRFKRLFIKFDMDVIYPEMTLTTKTLESPGEYVLRTNFNVPGSSDPFNVALA